MNEITQIKAKKISQLSKPSDYILKNGFDDLWMLLGYFSEDGSKNIVPTNYRTNLSKLYDAIYTNLDGRLTDRINDLVERINNKLRNDYVTKNEFDNCCSEVHRQLENLERALEELEEKVDNYHTNVFDISYTGLSSNVAAFGADGLSPRPTGIREGSTATITIKPVNLPDSDKSGYHLPDTINVHGAEYTWTLNDDGTGTLFLSNPTSAISLEIAGEPNTYPFSVSEDEHAHLITENIPDNIGFEDVITLVYELDNGYDLDASNITIENGTRAGLIRSGNTVEIKVRPNGLGENVSVKVASTLKEYSIVGAPEGDSYSHPISWPASITIENTIDNPITLQFRSDEGYKANIIEVVNASYDSYTHDPETGMTTINIYDPTGNVRIKYSSTSLMNVYFGVLHDQSLFTYTIEDEEMPDEWMPTGFATSIENTGLHQFNECPISDGVTLDFGSYPEFYADSIIVIPKQFFGIKDSPFDTWYVNGESTYRLYRNSYEVNVPKPDRICDLGEHDGVEYWGLRFFDLSGVFAFREMGSD